MNPFVQKDPAKLAMANASLFGERILETSMAFLCVQKLIASSTSINGQLGAFKLETRYLFR